MVSRKVKVMNPSGLHVPASGKLCDAAMNYSCSVRFRYGDEGVQEANAKSVLSILGACVKAGDEITLICEGADEEEACEHIADLFEKGFFE
ncbi:MAG: HPr family phosphocarrier protein [Lachnospiraceae bacterium]|nr:HPr family phosphocarrier protein [Lachnospiraceae bacterium]